MPSWIQRLLGLVAGGLPTVLVLAVLAGVAAWGSKNEWTLGNRKPTPKEDEEKETDARKAGVEAEKVEPGPLTYEVSANGVLAFDQTHYAQLSTRAAGTVWHVSRKVGERVKAGEVLALVAAAEVGRIKAEFQTAHLQHEVRAKVLRRLEAAAGSVPERQIRDARLSLREARVHLLNSQQALANLGLVLRLEEVAGRSDDDVAERLRPLGVPPELIKANGLPALPGNLLPMVAPFDGLVIRRDVVLGEVVEPSKPQFVVAQVERLWVMLDVRLEDAARVAVGQEVTFRPDAGGQPATGTLTWVSAEVDRKTRTVRARAEVENYAGRLRPATFGTARIVVGRNPEAVAVPDAAVQWSGSAHLVFVRADDEGKEYRPRVILPGARAGGYTEVGDARPLLPAAALGLLASPGGWAPLQALAALPVKEEADPHDPRAFRGLGRETYVATTGSQVLKSELLKDRIGGED
jgi:cobalt-zinc-cadmium efflux system membrane fusion protein